MTSRRSFLASVLGGAALAVTQRLFPALLEVPVPKEADPDLIVPTYTAVHCAYWIGLSDPLDDEGCVHGWTSSLTREQLDDMLKSLDILREPK